MQTLQKYLLITLHNNWCETCKNNFILPKSTSFITKTMSSNPRRISKISVEINFETNNLSEKQIKKLIKVAKGCPVAQSLSSDLIQEINYNF